MAEASKPIAEFTGEAEVKAQLDYIALTISVIGDCQESPKNAQAAVDKVVAQIDSYLQKLKRPNDHHFKILVDGGYTSQYSRYYNNKNLCDKTFQKETNITLNIGNSSDFSQIFSKVQSQVLGHFEQESYLGEEVARTYVRLGTPEPELTKEHSQKLAREALDLAFTDAFENFKAATKSCKNLGDVKVHNIKEASSYIQPKFAMRANYQAGVAQDAQAPVRFEASKVKKSLLVGFSFDGSCF